MEVLSFQEERENDMFSKKYFYPAAAVLVIAGAVLRLTDLFNAFQYDELWSWQFYAGKSIAAIFQDLATPNNHPLNSLLMKWIWALCGDSPSLSLFRLPAYFAGIGCMVLMIPLAQYFTGSRLGTLTALFLLAVNPWAILYASQARGYSLQLFLLMATGAAILKLYNKAENPLVWSIAAGLCGILSVLTISSSILFLLPMLGILFLKRRDIYAWGLYAASGIFCVCWYGLNFASFRAGQQFGVELNTLDALRGHFIETPYALCGAALLFALIPLRKKSAWALYGCFLFPLLAAFASKAGGTRVYLPCVIPVLLAAGMGISILQKKFRRKVLIVLLISAAAGVWHWQTEYDKIRMIDWWELYARHKEIPQNTLIVYPGNAAYPAQMNNPTIGVDYANRLIEPEKLLMLMDSEGINGVAFSRGEARVSARGGQEIDLGVCRGYLYDLKEKTPETGELVLLLNENKTTVKLPDHAVFLNLHFQLPEEKRNTNCVVFRFEKGCCIPDGARCFVIAE